MGTKVQALQQWCKKQTEGYRDVNVVNMTSSWKNGLAFCAIIHRYRPDLIDYDALSKENVLENNTLAFEVADRELGIPALLDAPDMVAIRVPDKLSVVTYVSQYYNYFHNKPSLGGPGVKKSVKRQQEPDKSGPTAKRQTLTAVNDPLIKQRQVSMGDNCGICNNKVYLLERHIENGKLYHRTCFRKNEVSPSSKKLPKTDSGQHVSKDEEKPDFWRRRTDAKKNEQIKREETKRAEELEDKQETVKTNKAKSQNFTEIGKDENKSKLNVVSQRQDEKMDISSPYIDPKVETKAGSNSNRPVSKAGNLMSPRDTINTYDNNSKESDKRISVPKFEFRSKIVSTAPKACIVSKIDTDNSELQPTMRHSAPPKPSRLSESPQLLKSTHPHLDGSESPPPLPKDLQPHLPATSKKDSRVTENSTVSPSSVKSSAFGEKSSKQDRLSELLEKDSQNSQGIHEDVSSKSRVSEPFTSGSTKQEFRALKNPETSKLQGVSDVSTKTNGTSEPVAVLVSPVSPEPHDPKVLGGLLKQLANVRQKKDSKAEVNKRVTSPKLADEQSKNSEWKSDKTASNNRKELKSLESKEATREPVTRADKAKSVDFLSQKKSLSDKRESDEPRLTFPIKTDDSDKEPAWKKALADQKKKKEEKRKSADLLSDKKSASDTRRVVSMDMMKDKDEKPAWQIEVEKRKAAQQGGFVDPEKLKLEQGFKFKTKDSSSEDSIKTEVTKRHIIPGVPPEVKSTSEKISEPEKKKISVGKRFEFKLEDNEKKKITDKPPRPPPMSPPLGQNFHHGLSPAVSNKLASTKKSPAPTPPRPAMPRSEIKTFGDMKRLSPQEIQQQLADIDASLTDLETRGRQLEESIRKDDGEDDDEGLMIEWFKLVNDKNDLIRTEGDLMYISKAQELEDEQHSIDRQLRELLSKPDNTKTEEDKHQEEALLQRLVDVVNQRSVIVDSQDEDRIRYEEEDRDIAEILATKEFCKKTPPENSTEKIKDSKEDKRAEKKKKKKNKKDKK